MNPEAPVSGTPLGTLVIPVRNEAQQITAALAALPAAVWEHWRVRVVDGGSEDDTLVQARAFPVEALSSAPGRARQMNAGARDAVGHWLVFLHVDTRLPADFQQQILTLANTSVQWGRFDVTLEPQRWPFPLIAWFINQRSALTGVCTGDQTLFVRRDFFQALGGFADIPLMEDVAFSLRARRHCRPLRLRSRVRTSAHRWQRHGVVKTVLLMWWLRLAYRLGVSPHRLHHWYYGSSG